MRRRHFLAVLGLLWAKRSFADERRRLVVALCGDPRARVTAAPPPLPARLDDAAIVKLRVTYPDLMRAFEEELRIALYASPRHGGVGIAPELRYP